MKYKIKADFEVIELEETFSTWIYTKKAIKSALDSGAKVTIEKVI